MLDIGKFDVAMELEDMSETFCEALAYLAQKPQALSVRNGIREGIRALSPQYEAGFFLPLERILSHPMPEAEKLLEFGDELARASANMVSRQISDMCLNEPYIEPEIARRIFGFYDAVPHTSNVGKMLFFACEKSSFTLPMESFLYSMKLIEEFPDMLKEDQTHRGYVYRPSEQHVFDSCPICGGEGKPYFRAFTYRMANFCYPHLPFRLWMKCQKCGNMYTWKQPKEWLAMSDRSERIDPCEGFERFYATQSNGVQFLADWGNVLDSAARYTKGKNLIEVGVGTGAQLAVALEMGFDVDAVEIDAHTARKVSDLLHIPIWRGDFLKFSSAKQYSVVIMGDVIEHMTNPMQALQKAYDILEAEGVLWLSTPNFESSFSRMMKFQDFMWCVQNHITYFSFEGIRKLAKQCGFEVREYKVSSRYNGSMELILTKYR